MTKTEVMALLKENRNERGMAHWRKRARKDKTLKSYGIGLTQLRRMAKLVGRDHELALQLWKSDVYDAKVIGLLIDDPKQITREQIEQQVDDLNNGLLAHVFATCGATLAKSPLVFTVMPQWLQSRDTMRRRCGFLLLYEVAKNTTKKAPSDEFFLNAIERIRNEIHDEDHTVQDAMTGALMGIGKRDANLNAAAIAAVKAIGPVRVADGNDSCEPLDVMKHLTSDYLRQKFAVQAG